MKPADRRAIVEKLVAQAKAGDLTANKELFDRLFGKSPILADVGIISDGPQIVRLEFDDNFFGNADRLKATRPADAHVVQQKAAGTLGTLPAAAADRAARMKPQCRRLSQANYPYETSHYRGASGQ